MKRITRRSRGYQFSLLEIILTIAILSLISGFFAINSRGLLRQYSFKQDTQKLSEYCTLAKELAMSYQADVELQIESAGEAYNISLRSDEPALKNIILPATLKHIKRMTFQGVSIPASNIFLFSSTGWVFPRGILKVESQSDLVQMVEFK